MITLDEIIKKYFDFSNLRHAYLLKTNNYSKVIEIAKKIILDSNFNDSNVANLIDQGMYSDLIIVDVSMPVVPVTSGLNIAVFW